MSDGNAFVYTERDMRAIIQAERERIAQAIDSFLVRFDPKGPAYWPVSEAARIARNGGSDA